MSHSVHKAVIFWERSRKQLFRCNLILNSFPVLSNPLLITIISSSDSFIPHIHEFFFQNFLFFSRESKIEIHSGTLRFPPE
jgi:hypothetical protein